MNIFREVADIKTANQLHLPVPEVEYHNVALKLLTAPIVLTIDLFTLACVGIISCSAILFRIVSSIVALLGVMVLVTYSPKNGIILLAIAFLVSPMGLPMFAVRILGILQSFSHFLRATWFILMSMCHHNTRNTLLLLTKYYKENIIVYIGTGKVV